MSIRPDNLTLDKLLQGKLFRIPDYQRTYSWETRQRQDLFEDIKKLAKASNNERNDHSHFMSTIVCLKTSKIEEVGADEFGVFQIVDGQQRLTTLIIILKALAKNLSSGNDIERKESMKLSELLVKENGRLILLQTNHDSKSIFREYLEKGNIPNTGNGDTLAEKNMIQAFDECENFVNQWSSEILSLLKLVKNRLDFIFYVLDDEASVHTIFEVLNSRGLEVDWLDKCKSMLMGIAFKELKDAKQEYIKDLEDDWSNIYRTIGINKKIPGQEILKFAATLEDISTSSKMISAENAMTLFRKKCEGDKGDPRKVIEVSKRFLRITKQLKEFVTNPRIKAITNISQARLLGISVMLNENLNSSDKKKILEKWEKITFRIFGLYRKDARTKVGDYVRLAKDIFNKEMATSEILERITEIGSDYPADKAAEQLRDTNCYEGWENELIYFMYRYEEYLAKENNGSISETTWAQVWNSSSNKTIEHIHPQSQSNSEWRGKFGTKADFIKRQSQRLGNLIILPPSVNSIAGNKSFLEKKEIYEKHRELKLINEIIMMEDWDSKAMEERENRLIEWASREWM